MADLTKSIPARVEELVLDGTVKAVNVDNALTVSIPGITEAAGVHDKAKVDETVTGVALGDSVLVADPVAAFVDEHARFLGAYVSATDTVTFMFGSEGGDVTTEDVDFALIWLDRT